SQFPCAFHVKNSPHDSSNTADKIQISFKSFDIIQSISGSLKNKQRVGRLSKPNNFSYNA
ncbi:hypothetical protein, partial [Kingella kingae]|uniref:hypothetical protein n=1 Tax=Kingella kingae TaxID=504 RepID=UPI00254C2E4C